MRLATVAADNDLGPLFWLMQCIRYPWWTCSCIKPLAMYGTKVRQRLFSMVFYQLIALLLKHSLPCESPPIRPCTLAVSRAALEPGSIVG